MELAQPPPERRAVVEVLGDQRPDVSREPLAHLPLERAALADGEHDAGRQADHEQHPEEVEVDAGVESPHRQSGARARRYPTPRTVLMRRGALGSSSSLARSFET